MFPSYNLSMLWPVPVMECKYLKWYVLWFYIATILTVISCLSKQDYIWPSYDYWYRAIHSSYGSLGSMFLSWYPIKPVVFVYSIGNIMSNRAMMQAHGDTSVFRIWRSAPIYLILCLPPMLAHKLAYYSFQFLAHHMIFCESNQRYLCHNLII